MAKGAGSLVLLGTLIIWVSSALGLETYRLGDEGAVGEPWSISAQDLLLLSLGTTEGVEVDRAGGETWLRPIQLDSTRNILHLVFDRAGVDPTTNKASGARGNKLPYVHGATDQPLPEGMGYILDDDIETAYIGGIFAGRFDFKFDLWGRFWINRIRVSTRPDFPQNFFREGYAIKVHEADETRTQRGRLENSTEPLQLTLIKVGEVGTYIVQRDRDGRALRSIKLDEKGRAAFDLTTGEPLPGDAILAPYQHLGPPLPPGMAEFRFDPFLVDRVDLDPSNRPFEIAEFEAYGVGFADGAFYLSSIIDLGQPVNFGALRWKAERIGEGLSGEVAIRTRSGRDDDPHLYLRYINPQKTRTSDRNEAGEFLDRDRYKKLSITERVEPQNLPRDVENWSGWSSPFNLDVGLIGEDGPGGGLIASPSQRRYLQIRIDFLPSQLDAVRFDYLEFDFSSPLYADEIIAEIFPGEVALGEITEFRYAVKSRFTGSGATGFDRIDIEVPDPEAHLEVLSIEDVALDEIILDQEAVESLGRDPAKMNELEIGDGTFVQVLGESEGRHVLMLKFSPRVETSRGEQFVEVVFRSRVFKFFTRFSGRIGDSERPGEVSQQIEEGDVIPEFDTDKAAVFVASERDDILGDLKIAPRIFTPNGDGVNDKVALTYHIFFVHERGVISLDFFDLAGWRVKHFQRQNQSAGRATITWDGRDEAGQHLSPGIYLYRLALETDQQKVERVGTVSIVY